ncbi:F-box domain-containing protein [Mycena sanguinolenta]|uniref:F-box domain-containing protein n=1 Tax=Mycena sanguinolenta TaxID=230812 RepID=A0A8H6YX19_9AGAR|nr:F-box domain-containing protein [Mycena sanguinolenta]
MAETTKPSTCLDNPKDNNPLVKHKSAVVHRIPTETLSHIFTFTLPPHRLNDEPAPWTISAVCSHWRETVICQPGFWVFIDLRYFNRQKFTNRFRLETQLSRSASLPLSVNFTTLDRTFSSEDLSLLQLITVHARRWETLSMMGPVALYTGLYNCLRDQLTLLRVLEVEVEGGRADGQDDGVEVDENDLVPLLVAFKDAPRLQKVTANKIYYPFPLSLALPWSQVLRFRGSNKWNGHLRMLRSATNLVSCALQLPPETEPLPLPQSPILLPHLLQLSLPDAAILECLETPALQELYCPYAPALLSFLRRQRDLRKLFIGPPPAVWQTGIGWVPGEAPDLTRTVAAASTITILVLMLPVPAEFARDFSNLDMVPALEQFAPRLIPKEDNHELQNDFMHAVESRWQHGRLRSVKMPRLPGPWAPGFLDRIEQLQAQGMEFVLGSSITIRDEMTPDF